MFVAAIVHKIGTMIRGPRKVENLSLEFTPKATLESQSQNASTKSSVPVGRPPGIECFELPNGNSPAA